MSTERLSFMFYTSWSSQLEVLSDKELRRFIENLICFHRGTEVNLKSKPDKLVWNGVLPALILNDKKYQETVERNRENGKKGGRPKKNN
jgi:hypothetical protein